MKTSEKQNIHFIFLRLKVVSGEYEYNVLSVHSTQCSNITFFAHRYAASFYIDKGVYREGNAWFSHAGCVATSVELVKEISNEHFKVLQEYLR